MVATQSRRFTRLERVARGITTLGLLCALASAGPVQAQVPLQAQPGAGEQVSLNFVDASIETVVRSVGQFIGRTFLVDPRVQGNITLVSERPVTAEQALSMILSSLRLQGFAVVDVGGILRVLPEADARLQGGMVFPDGSRPAGDQLVTQVFQLQHENATALVPVLRPLIAPNNPINVYPGNNTLVITDYADNLRRIAQIVAAIDQAAFVQTEIIELEHGIASDIATLVARMLERENPAGPVPLQDFTLLADPRSNTLLLRTSSPQQAVLAHQLIRQLDRPGAAGGQLHVVHLRNAEARHVAEVLGGVLSSLVGQSASTSSGGGGDQSSGPATLSVQPAATESLLEGDAASAAPGTSMNTGASLAAMQAPGLFSVTAGNAAIQADPTTNTLIITAPEPIYRELRRVIDRLDVRRAQVFIESLIVEVSSDSAADFGIQWFGNLDQVARGGTAVIGGATFGGTGNNTPLLAAGQNLGSLGAGLNIGVVRGTVTVPGIGTITNLGLLARALETQSGANILSTPNLLTLDNEMARIVIGQNVPIITGQFTQTGGTSGVTPFQTIERRDVGLALQVRPQVSEGGTVRLSIYQEVSNVVGNNASGPVFNKRAIDTNVLVDDGQIIVLGGLIEDTASTAVEQVPGLGDVPIVGNLFRYENRERRKTSLMVFLRPYVLRDASAERSVMMDRYEFLRRSQQASQPRPHWALPELGAPQLPEMASIAQAAGVNPSIPLPPVETSPAAQSFLLPDNYPTVTLQVGPVFSQEAPARRLATQLQQHGLPTLTRSDGVRTRVLVELPNEASALQAGLDSLHALGHNPIPITVRTGSVQP